ncbi:MAG TPA: hypothetical protein VGG72_02245 [Bryobacteraceae bacterium]|jgi:hypothetical protein
MGVPDIRFINRNIPIADVARELGLRFGANGNIHCWQPESHQHGDRTASVGIRRANNTVKCFGCDIGPLGPIDMVMAVRGFNNPGQAARWIAERFVVPELPPGRHLVEPRRRIFQFGFESSIALLVHSGLWAELSPTSRSIVPVFLELGDPVPGTQNLSIQISYRALARYAGVTSHNAIFAALRELQGIHWLCHLPSHPEPGVRPMRATGTYLVTPKSDELLELAHSNTAQMRSEIDIERKLRAEAKQQRRNTLLTK